jgi:cyclopropane-fatty-acyl-phospholipid synthase
MWEYYLAYCEGGFLERAITDVQLVFDKPLCRLAAPAPA